MKTGTEVLAVIEQIAATSSKTEKERLVATFKGHPLAERILIAAYDPFVTYGITAPADTYVFGTNPLTIESPVWATLAQLASRELTGNAAAAAVRNCLAWLDGPGSTLFWRILKRDMRAGFTSGTINRAIPNLIYVFEVMLAHKFEEKRIKQWPVAIEPKLDGVRVIAIVKDGAVTFHSRTGNEFTTFEGLKPAILSQRARRPDFYAKGFVLEGEVVSGAFNKTVGDVRRKSEQAVDAEFYVFDLLYLDEFQADKVWPDHERRRAELAAFVGDIGAGPVKLIEQRLARSHEEIWAYFAELRAKGVEGVIVKPLTGLYQKKRSHAWLKIKEQETIDVRVIGGFEGEGKYAGMLGGLIVDVDGVEVRVGGGFSDQQRHDFWHGSNDVMGRLIEVEFHEKTPDGSLRHPRFVRFRDDKDTALAA